MRDKKRGPRPEVRQSVKPAHLRGAGRGEAEMNMPQAIEVVDEEGRWAVYVPLKKNGKVVRPKRSPGD